MRSPPPPPGTAKRVLMFVWRAATWAYMPSNTLLPSSAWLKPRCKKVFIALPDCEVPCPSVCVMRPATGLAVPLASAALLRKKLTVSRSAARPTPMTLGSLAT